MSIRGRVCSRSSRPPPQPSVPSPGRAVAPPGSPRQASPAPRAPRDRAPSSAGPPGPCSLSRGASSRCRALRGVLGPRGLGESDSQVLLADMHRRFGETVVGPRKVMTPGPLRSSDEGESSELGLNLREQWVVLSIPT